MIAAVLVGHHLKLAAREGRGGTRAAEMDEGGKILPLLRAWLRVANAGENVGNIAVEIDGRQLDGMARDRTDIEAGHPAAGIGDRMVADQQIRFDVTPRNMNLNR